MATIATGVPNITPPYCVNCRKAPISPYSKKNTILSRLMGHVFLIIIIGRVNKKRNNKG
ncbi:MAG: hypothetical protein AMQ74_01966 [Candidatus Methanofastidiosum methylothiophilum]|uniref:Uncharacterized protein n=1 Tax=Candidatus Methanofastidiosum methylothiophilum TaxID=1705564 RepID=A0A150IHJ1_9EURY|nr:MAG: hypothetical protein AMQ74_01966 [Candidatus Methanofastidiosum methylthiophilus]